MPAQPDTDGQVSFEGGQDASLPPGRLPGNRFAAGVNLSTSEGTLRPRFALCRKKLVFPAGGYSWRFNKIADFKFLFKSGKFQAHHEYQIGTKYYQVVVISGVIFMIDQSNMNVKVLTLNAETQLSETAPRINVFDAGKYLAFSDFPNKPVLVEDGVARRSREDLYELPAFNVGTYNQSRAFFSNKGNEFTAGDPVGNPLTPNAPITIEEVALSGSPYFQDTYTVPSKFDSPIRALTTLQAVDSSTGIGTLIAGTNNQIFAFDTVKPRDEWLDGQFGKCISFNAGIMSSRALTHVGSDLFFVSEDGHLRSLSAAQGEQKKWARVPMSVPVKNWVLYYSDELSHYTEVCYFKNKIFWTVKPYWTDALRLNGSPILDVAHAGMVVLNLDNIARGDVDAAPAWEGLWTGVRPMSMCVNDERMFIMSKDSGSNEFYEVLPDETVDRTDEGYTRQITSIVYTRDHFAKNSFVDKQLERLESNITDISGKFKYKVDFKPSDSGNFLSWGELNFEVLNGYREFCNGKITERVGISLKDLNLNKPSTKDGNPITHDLYTMVKRAQFRLEITADNWKLNEYLITAILQEPQVNKQETKDFKTVEEFRIPSTDWNYKEFGL